MNMRTMTRQLLVPVFAAGILAHALFYAGDAWSAPSCDSASAVLKVYYEEIARGKYCALATVKPNQSFRERKRLPLLSQA